MKSLMKNLTKVLSDERVIVALSTLVVAMIESAGSKNGTS